MPAAPPAWSCWRPAGSRRPRRSTRAIRTATQGHRRRIEQAQGGRPLVGIRRGEDLAQGAEPLEQLVDVGVLVEVARCRPVKGSSDGSCRPARSKMRSRRASMVARRQPSGGLSLPAGLAQHLVGDGVHDRVGPVLVQIACRGGHEPGGGAQVTAASERMGSCARASARKGAWGSVRVTTTASPSRRGLPAMCSWTAAQSSRPRRAGRRRGHLQREDDIVGRHLLAIVEPAASADRDGPGAAVLAHAGQFPGQRRDRLRGPRRVDRACRRAGR